MFFLSTTVPYPAAAAVFCFQEDLDLVQSVLEQDCQGRIVNAEEAETIQKRRQDHLRKAFESRVWQPREDLHLGGMGSGFTVSTAGHLVTNHHVVDDCAALSALTPQGDESEVRLIRSAVTRDLALLQLSAGALKRRPAVFVAPHTRLRVGSPTAGAAEPVHFLGYPNRGRPPLLPFDRPGELWQLTDQILDIPVIVFKGEVSPGNSGGPLLDDKDRVIGLVFAEANAPAFRQKIDKAKAEQMVNVGFALPHWEILLFLDQAGIDYQVASHDDEKAPGSDQFMVRINCWR